MKMPLKSVKLVRNSKAPTAFQQLLGPDFNQQQSYTLLSSDELLHRMVELEISKDRDKCLIFVAAVLAWILTGNLSDKVFGVQLTGFVAGIFVVVFGNNIVGAFRLGVEQAILETISELGLEEIRERAERDSEIQQQLESDADLGCADRSEQTREFWINYTKFRRTTYQYVGLANVTNWVFILSILWTLYLGVMSVWNLFWG